MRLIKKASGEKEPFNIKKFKRSLLRSGASEKTIERLIDEVEKRKDLETTFDIYRYALDYLVSQRSHATGRYNLKKALFKLGPSGFPFEKFLAKIFEQQGYSVSLNQIISGKCATYEIDLLLKKDEMHHFVESKFHGKQGRKADIQVTLYSKARFDDIEAHYTQKPYNEKKELEAWVITNTRFTSKAIRYANCVGLKVVDWSYPSDGSLAVLIDTLGVHPVTALTSLSSKQARSLIEKGLVLCREVKQHVNILKEIGLDQRQISRVVKEAEET